MERKVCINSVYLFFQVCECIHVCVNHVRRPTTVAALEQVVDLTVDDKGTCDGALSHCLDKHLSRSLIARKKAHDKESAKRKEQRALLRSLAHGSNCTRNDVIVAVSALVQEDGSFDSDGRALAILAAWRKRVQESQAQAKWAKSRGAGPGGRARDPTSNPTYIPVTRVQVFRRVAGPSKT